MFTSNTSNVYILWKEKEVKEPHAAIASFFFLFFLFFQISFFPNLTFAGGRNKERLFQQKTTKQALVVGCLCYIGS